ncbi:GNAT family acetyltransferase [Sinorhizobium fredii USDA 205]|uniref:GNAT family N-acetyltransferase n=1 Tax=Rhizobium fredii TaxID=380 RepID=A0A844A6L9_RHIFR|nr:GNAT family N-acetyltransferase [Sinorhizobium fredii]KSV82860.1 GNAT family acetyltransferase [Sinorhizobium fredii USDA 205]MQX07276.1 GNAT family N-acetyltransferase [Sinorhizobium fredii]GEC34372.1 N-acetyltransferase [Sinorhizobium fredii]GLS06394.1 N-acetyltransferase [Sinorhizobium fredii]
MIICETPRLRIRNWREGDRGLFAEINSDPKVMEFFPFRRSRAESDALFDRNARTIRETGFGFFALALHNNDLPIGFCGLARTDLEPHLSAGTIEIGWRLALSHWGEGYVTEAALALLDHGFGERKLSEIVSFAVATNARSTAVMRPIGMRPDPLRDFDHPGVPDTRSHLKRHVLWAVTKKQWRTAKSSN